MLIVQLLLNGLVIGCGYALVALGFVLVYNTTRIFHFAHGAVYTFSVYLFYTMYNLWHWPFVIALVLTLVLVACLGIVIDEVIHAPLVRRNASLLIHLLSSLGLYIVLINLIAMVYGNETKILSFGTQPTYSLGSVVLTRIQIVTAFVFVVLFGVLHLVLHRTRLGKMIRAMHDDPDLVAVIGLSPRLIRWMVFAIGSALAAVAALLMGLDVGIEPNIGMAVILNGVVAVIIGGLGLFESAALGALLLGLLQGMAIWQASARWQDAITFLALVICLLFRPQGILGKRRRIEETAT